MFGEAPALPQRFEYKYLITERQADLVRGFALSHLGLDPHADPARGNRYPVHSLYLDTRGLGLYHSSCGGEKNRFKLRVRYYDFRVDTPVFVEVKARKGDAIQKRRAPVAKERLQQVLTSFCPSPDDLAVVSPGGLAALSRFCELGSALAARPKLVVRYVREAYVDRDGGPLRVTIDRAISCLHRDAPIMAPDGANLVQLRNRWAILEIKFTDVFPRWVRDMVQALSLRRTSAAKYVQSVNALWRAGYGLA